MATKPLLPTTTDDTEEYPSAGLKRSAPLAVYAAVTYGIAVAIMINDPRHRTLDLWTINVGSFFYWGMVGWEYFHGKWVSVRNLAVTYPIVLTYFSLLSMLPATQQGGSVLAFAAQCGLLLFAVVVQASSIASVLDSRIQSKDV